MKKTSLTVLLVYTCTISPNQIHSLWSPTGWYRPKRSRTEQTIIIEGKTIRSVENGYIEAPEGTTLVDLKDHYVLPGLMDMHVHIEGESNPKRYENRFRDNPADCGSQSHSIL